MASRAVYLCLFNSREDVGHLALLHDFLLRIKALAPDAPVLLVGTRAGSHAGSARLPACKSGRIRGLHGLNLRKSTCSTSLSLSLANACACATSQASQVPVQLRY